ncbi:hypothetical protein LY90DRAFT_378197 [Neocallimastix californiae]|uniref:HTH APSES-type domain-containing protein n=1 Tax=Neocallimastix californiae TaxID=1754190 RepID=A0A1Y2ES59_9FUNG|nr:hypothetical protein LY90DRAFT_378197 [Neocallimastix californiae]|eukprot:ORY74408.1 hypothetical protein LY90DRAFT_378197 [Neocallimastix californiae]
MKSNTTLNTDINSNKNNAGVTNDRNEPQSFYTTGGKSIKRPPSPLLSKLSKRSMTHLKSQYLTDINIKGSYPSSGNYQSSKYIPSANVLDPSMTITTQKDKVTELNKKAYAYTLSTSAIIPPFSSPAYEEHQNQTSSFNEMVIHSKQGFNDQSQIILQETNLNNGNAGSSTILNTDSTGSSQVSVNSSLNTLLDSISSNFNSTSTDHNNNLIASSNNSLNIINSNLVQGDIHENNKNDNGNKSLQDCLPTPCSSINSTPTNKHCNDHDELENVDFKENFEKETIYKPATLSDNVQYNGQDQYISNNEINVITRNSSSNNSSINTLTNLNVDRRSLGKSYSLPLMTPESSSISNLMKDSKSSTNSSSTPIATPHSKSINLSYSTRHPSLYSSSTEFSNTSNSSLMSISHTVSGHSRYPLNNNNFRVTSTSEFRSPYINTSTTSSMNAMATNPTNPMSNLIINDSETFNEISTFDSKPSFQNKENDDSRTFIESQLLLQNNSHQLTEISSINNDSQVKNPQTFIDSQYNPSEEETNSIPQTEKINSIQLNNTNNTQMIFKDNQLSSKTLILEREQNQLAQTIPELYETQQNTLPFEQNTNQNVTFTQQFTEDTGNQITKGTIENSVSFNINLNNSLDNPQQQEQTLNRNDQNPSIFNTYPSNTNSNFNSSNNNDYEQNSANFPSQYNDATNIQYFYNDNAINNNTNPNIIIHNNTFPCNPNNDKGNNNNNDNNNRSNVSGDYNNGQCINNDSNFSNPHQIQENLDNNNGLYKSSYSTSIPSSYKNETTLIDNQNNSFYDINDESLVRTSETQTEEPRLILIPWEDKNTFVFQLKVGSRTLSRRIDNHTVNGTKLLNIAGLTRGRRDGILKNEKERNVIKHGPLNLKGVWIPLSRARLITEKHRINPDINIILEDDPSKYLDKESQMELQGIYEPYMRKKDKYADNDYISNKYSGVIENYFQNSMPSQPSNQRFDPYFTQYINNNQNGLTELHTETIGTSSAGMNPPPPPSTHSSTHPNPNPLSQNTDYMNRCDLDYIIHEQQQKKNFAYSGNEPTYYKPSQNERFQQDVRYNFQYSNINKALEKNPPPTQQSINRFSQIPPSLHSQLSPNSYQAIYDNPNVRQTLQYNPSLPKQIPSSSFNTLSNYSNNPNPTIIYQNWINNNNIASINGTEYNNNNAKYNDERISQINNSNYHGFSSNNINY